MTTIQISTRVDDKIKDMAQKVFERQGLDVSTALKMFITKTAYEQEVPLSLKNSETTIPYPADWFTEGRIETRKNITDLAFQNSQIQKLDLSKKEDIKDFFDD
ncbi:type II toxin-antitoxin system RelB/DinJ family antitoxin [Pseudolactococcus reticulitermitis]|uniref:Uncharacterized protein n=1 Tax=Pseudolactococcus reticulitermitis TaxID=2025039 RepID=A0A224WW34_9LACT|nr:type II toxin-antitoxin system RelB/DinJ family antitoxin [Lactococcus reticulitermitis]GAX46537.1 hypothetical protein RsY01_116 [Lactococcus reticulitermitis]